MKTSDFRKINRDKVSIYYSGIINFTILIITCIILGIAPLFLFIKEIRYIELCTIPIAILIANIFEYVTHRFAMHNKIKFFGKLYKSHAGKHHRYFTYKEMEIDCDKDLRQVFAKPKFVILFTILVLVPISFILGKIFSFNISVLFFSTIIFYYFFHEICHLVSHVSDSNFLLKIKFFEKIKKRHKIHHNTKMMREKNFNISFPMMDILFKTFKD